MLEKGGVRIGRLDDDLEALAAREIVAPPEPARRIPARAVVGRDELHVVARPEHLLRAAPRRAVAREEDRRRADDEHDRGGEHPDPPARRAARRRRLARALVQEPPQRARALAGRFRIGQTGGVAQHFALLERRSVEPAGERAQALVAQRELGIRREPRDDLGRSGVQLAAGQRAQQRFAFVGRAQRSSPGPNVERKRSSSRDSPR